MNEPSTSSTADSGETSNEDKSEKHSESKQQKTNVLQNEKNDSSNHSSESLNFPKFNIDDSAYFIYHPPKYKLPPYLDPNLIALELRERLKVICSYHTLISKSIVQQAKIQVDSCSYPEPINPVPSRNDSSVDNKNYTFEVLNDCQGSGDNSEEYISRHGRKTKRKFYAENKVITQKDSNTSSTDTGQEDGSTRKKAALTPTRNRNSRQRQVKSEISGEESESVNNSNARSHSPILSQKPQKRSNDGFIEPAAPAAAKRATRKTIKCPICGLDFPEKEVEQHASSCGELPIVADNMNPNAAFRCDSCKEVMRTLDEYEIHCTTCNGGPSHLQ
ncbi:uncharacterized protein LOC123306852 [Coccinella septempunctata]|uniref:uncharacterized protein LOC123306852 n=1 Tax=Coccinella septempunctata TaxID=41139 RepID=UPI001D06E6F2|nr:uncharacterized protein LOC123306852 [Coccinella septempunctata]